MSAGDAVCVGCLHAWHPRDPCSSPGCKCLTKLGESARSRALGGTPAPTVSPLEAAWAEADRLEDEARADSAEADRWIKIAQDKYAAHVHARGYARTLGPQPAKRST